ncbi:MAG: phenylalanine--tRNA ligase subunit beta [Thermoanaerobaculales bacterium]|nr:phenylalanine--tRNA ligase subunit beta [Thermoanaerobaculales bacterium]
MKFDLEWLREYLETDADADTLAERLTHCGLLVETRDEVDSTEVWDIEVTTNRPDAMNHRGLAREAAVAVKGRLKTLQHELEETTESAQELAAVEIRDPDLCSRYVARVIRGVRLIPSPQWLQDRLERCGVRPINAIVDATNYVLLETGQPLHAFDLDRLAGRRIVVRRANAGEILETLDGLERKLETDDLVIADAERAVALAGVMGGADSEIGDTTIDVLLESAHFDALSVRRSARRFAIHTEASHRFERGADPEMAPVAADLAARLIAELTGAKVCRGQIDVCPKPWKPTDHEFGISALGRFAGLEISASEVERILAGLEFAPRLDGDRVICTPPSFRGDIERTADLYEEIIRHVGYEAIPAELPILGTPPGRRHPNWQLIDRGRDAAVRAGLAEVVTWAFIEPQVDRRLEDWPLCPGKSVSLVNPLASTQAVMRRSLVPSLLGAARETLNQGERSLALFEQGRVFSVDHEGEMHERERLALVLSGGGAGWPGVDRVGFSELKGVVENILRDTAFPDIGWRRGGAPWLEQSEGAELVDAAGRVIGVCGRLGSEEAARWGLKQDLLVAELDLDAAAAEPVLPKFRPLPRFPAITADMTIEHQLDLPYSEIEAAVWDLAGERIEKVSMEARYSGKGLPAGHVRSTLRLVYRHPDRSLTQEEVNEAQEGLRSALSGRFDVQFT